MMTKQQLLKAAQKEIKTERESRFQHAMKNKLEEIEKREATVEQAKKSLEATKKELKDMTLDNFDQNCLISHGNLYFGGIGGGGARLGYSGSTNTYSSGTMQAGT